MSHVVHHILTGEKVLGSLIFKDTSSCFIYRQLGQGAMVIQTCDRTLGYYVVHLFLVEREKLVQCLAGFCDQYVDFTLEIHCLFFCHIAPLI